MTGEQRVRTGHGTARLGQRLTGTRASTSRRERRTRLVGLAGTVQPVSDDTRDPQTCTPEHPYGLRMDPPGGPQGHPGVSRPTRGRPWPTSSPARRAVAEERPEGGRHWRRALAAVVPGRLRHPRTAVVLAGCGTRPDDPTLRQRLRYAHLGHVEPGSQDPGSASPTAAPGAFGDRRQPAHDGGHHAGPDLPDRRGGARGRGSAHQPELRLPARRRSGFPGRHGDGHSQLRLKVTDKELRPVPEEPAEEPADHLHPGAPVRRRGRGDPARARYVGWIKACPNTLVEKGYSVDTGQSLQTDRDRHRRRARPMPGWWRT